MLIILWNRNEFTRTIFSTRCGRNWVITSRKTLANSFENVGKLVDFASFIIITVLPHIEIDGNMTDNSQNFQNL